METREEMTSGQDRQGADAPRNYSRLGQRQGAVGISSACYGVGKALERVTLTKVLREE